MEDAIAGVTEPSDTPYYNSAVFLVLIKNQTKHLVVDLRGINSLIIPKRVQLPEIEELGTSQRSSRPLSWILGAYF